VRLVAGFSRWLSLALLPMLEIAIALEYRERDDL
jgi:hypothetical protein